MKFLEEQLKKMEHLFEKGKPLAMFYPLFEAMDTFLMTPGKVTKKGPHVRDALDIKRVMVFVIIGLIPATLFGIYNTGYQILLAKGASITTVECWVLGAWKVIPIILVSYMVGGIWEVLFAVVRKHEINEGFLVTGLLFPLTLPPDMPLWQVAIGISFGVVFGKEIFGGTGMNIFNPALVARAFVFFAYPAQMSGSNIWVAVDGFTKATPLAVAKEAARGADVIQALQTAGYNFNNLLTGFIPGSIGETSALACVIGLVFLLITGVASWRTVAGSMIGLLGMATVFYVLRGPERLAIFALPPHWHLVLGGFAFGAVFMVTDPVSSCYTNTGRWIFGILVGILTVLIRVVNPAYPEGVMLSIIFMNAFAPLIDHFVIEAHIKKRQKLTTRAA